LRYLIGGGYGSELGGAGRGRGGIHHWEQWRRNIVLSM